MYEIYLITNQVNGKVYVGQATRGRDKRWKRHLNDTKAGSELRLHRAIRKYGSENFAVTLLATAETEEELNSLERFWIKELNSKDPEIGYNMTEGGEGCLGTVQSEETRDKRSKSLKGLHAGKFVGEKSYRFRHDLDSEKLVEMYQSGKSADQIADILGASKETVVSRLKALGVKFRSNSEAQKIRCSFPENTPVYREDVSTEDMILLFNQGMTFRAIGEAVGVSKKCVILRLRKEGIFRSPRRCNLDKEAVAKMYLEGSNAYEIADLLSVSQGTIYLALKELEIPIRPKSSQPKKALRTEKVCPLCRVLLPLSSYNKDKTTIDGHMSVCRECRKARPKSNKAKKETVPESDSNTEQILGPGVFLPGAGLSSPSQYISCEQT